MSPSSAQSVRVPFNDLGRSLAPIEKDCVQAIECVVARRRFLKGVEVAAFEEEFAAFLGMKRVVAVASGTDALALALLAAFPSERPSVAVPAFTAPPTLAAIRKVTDLVSFVDVEPETALLPPQHFGAPYVGVSVVVPVHLYGRAARIEVSGPIVIEDAAQAVGTKTICYGAAAAFSFYPTKNLGGFSDGGAVATNDENLAEEVRRLREYGADDSWDIARFGWNSRMSEIDAAVLRVKLPHVKEWNEARRALMRHYIRLLPTGMTKDYFYDCQSNFHIFPIKVRTAKLIRAYLLDTWGVETSTHYPTTLPNMTAVRPDPHVVGYPNSEAWAEGEISLPIFPGMIFEEVQYVCDSLQRTLEKLGYENT